MHDATNVLSMDIGSTRQITHLPPVCQCVGYFTSPDIDTESDRTLEGTNGLYGILRKTQAIWGKQICPSGEVPDSLY